MTTTPNVTPKFSQFARRLTCLFAALMVMFGSLSAKAGDQVPFKGKGQGAIVGAVPGPAGVALGVFTEGQATHLGEFTRLEELLLNPATGVVGGTIVFTAANGDQLVGVVAGGFVSQTTVVGTYTFAGGTGRFKNATGGTAFVVITPDGVHFTVVFDGTISSVKGQ